VNTGVPNHGGIGVGMGERMGTFGFAVFGSDISRYNSSRSSE